MAKQTLLPNTQRRILIRYFPVWVVLAAIFMLALPALLTTTITVIGNLPRIAWNAAEDVVGGVVELADDLLIQVGDGIDDAATPDTSGQLAPLFTPQVAYWEDDILRWAELYDLDPNLLATVMQIESCGHPTVSSVAGAQGLFQVMPFHFALEENQLDPDTNAMRGANFLNDCLNWSDGDVGLAMACYNGGPSVISKPFEAWLNEPQRYYIWGMGIYTDALYDRPRSDTLDRWLAAGGQNLCDRAAAELGLN